MGDQGVFLLHNGTEIPKAKKLTRKIQHVRVSQYVESIPYGAFKNCANLVEVMFNEGLRLYVIGKDSFKGCTALRSITLPEGLQIIGKGSFQGCTALLSITLPSTVTKLYKKAFSGCVNLAEVKLNEGLRLIDERAFQHCSALRSVTVPSTVNMWGRNIFWHCGNLSEVTFLGGKGLLKQEFIDRRLFDGLSMNGCTA